MSIQVLTRGKIVEAKPDGMGGPRWLAKLEDGTRIVGRPSWLGNSGPIALPNDECRPMSDWRRFMDRCAENQSRVKSISLHVPPHGWFHAPEGKAAYGYYEQVVNSMNSNKPWLRRQSGVAGVGIVWAEGNHTEGYLVLAAGVLEGRKWPMRLPCMILAD